MLIRALVLFALFPLGFAAQAQVQCGPQPENIPPDVQQRIQGDVEGKAQIFTKLLGDVNLKGKVNSSRNEVYQKFNDVDKSTIDRYMIWVSCQNIMLNSNLTTADKTKLWIDIYRELTQKHKDSAIEKQNKLLQSMSIDTQIEKVKEVYGSPEKELKSLIPKENLILQIYKGEQHKLLIIIGNGKNVGKFGVYKVSIDLDNKTEKAEKVQFTVFDDPFDEFTLQHLTEECDSVSPTGANARFFYFLTNSCYFGRPGLYQNYQFGYEIDTDDGACKKDPMEWDGKININKLGCNKAFMAQRPNFIFSSPDENDELGARAYDAVYWWDLHGF